MKQNLLRYTLLALLLLPFILFIKGLSNPSTIQLVLFICLIPIVGLFSKAKWFFYYVYVVAGFSLLISAISVVLMVAFAGLTSTVLFILYIIAILSLTILLHRDYLNAQGISALSVTGPGGVVMPQQQTTRPRINFWMIAGAAVIIVIVIDIFAVRNGINRSTMLLDQAGSQKKIDATPITWKKYSNPFIEFQYPPNFVITNEKVVSDHTISPSTKKDLYDFIALALQNTMDEGSLSIDVLPNYTHVGDNQFSQYQQDFNKEKSEQYDSFKIISVDGNKASFQHLEAFDHTNVAGVGTFRLGSNKVDFFTNNYVYDITLTWGTKKNNDSGSQLQTEFQKFISTLHVPASQ